MILKSDAKFLKKLTCGFKHDMRNLVNFYPTTQKPKNFTLMGYFCPKYMMFELKKYRGVIFRDTEQGCKIWIKLVVSKIAWGIWLTFIRAPKSLENCRMMDSFCSKHVMCFSYEISEEFCVVTLKGVAKFKGKLTCGLKNDLRNFVNFHASNQKSENL